MTPSAEQIEAGARAIRQAVAHVPPELLKRPFERLPKELQDAYRREARACLEAAFEARRAQERFL